MKPNTSYQQETPSERNANWSSSNYGENTSLNSKQLRNVGFGVAEALGQVPAIVWHDPSAY